MKILEITTKSECQSCGCQLTVVDIVSLRKIEKKKIEIPMPEKCTCHHNKFDLLDIKTIIREQSKEIEKGK